MGGRVEGESEEEEDPEVFGTCEWRGHTIRVGNACVTVDRHIEQVDWNEEMKRQEIEIIDAEALLTLCARCGNCLIIQGLRAYLEGAGR